MLRTSACGVFWSAEGLRMPYIVAVRGCQRSATECRACNERIYLTAIILFRLRRAE